MLMSRQKGVSLMEVLVSILILGVSLLGMSFLQGASLRANHQSHMRTQATWIAHDMIDRIRANMAGYDAGRYNDIDTDDTVPADPGCIADPAGCTEQQMAAYDQRLWSLNFHEAGQPDFRPLLPNGRAVVCRGTLNMATLACTVDANKNVLSLAVQWVEAVRDDRDDSDGEMESTATQLFMTELVL